MGRACRTPSRGREGGYISSSNVNSPQRAPEADDLEDAVDIVKLLDLSEEPITPKKEQSRNLWHGMPSPDTPTSQYPYNATSRLRNNQSIDMIDSYIG
ncbi:hypothetical protein PtrSN001A_011809 [Pyrenophora tritici-repentis]|nr:hypothetical protein PtrSN001A_011809 [Pyrenophora tritici-repentis]